MSNKSYGAQPKIPNSPISATSGFEMCTYKTVDNEDTTNLAMLLLSHIDKLHVNIPSQIGKTSSNDPLAIL